MTSILFVCLGNICRSSAAEEVFRQLVAQRGLSESFHIDSAGLIDYHEGELSDPRMRSHAARRGYRLTHRSRPVKEADFTRFDYIVGMDHDNMRQLQRRAASMSTSASASTYASASARLLLMADFLRHHDSSTIPDPYYGGPEDFDHVLDLLEDATVGLLAYIEADKL